MMWEILLYVVLIPVDLVGITFIGCFIYGIVSDAIDGLSKLFR